MASLADYLAELKADAVARQYAVVTIPVARLDEIAAALTPAPAVNCSMKASYEDMQLAAPSFFYSSP